MLCNEGKRKSRSGRPQTVGTLVSIHTSGGDLLQTVLRVPSCPICQGNHYYNQARSATQYCPVNKNTRFDVIKTY